MGDSSDLHRRTLDDSQVMEMAGKIMVVAIVALFVVAVLFFFRHVYAKWFCSQLPATGRRFDFAPGSSATTTVVVGLDLSVLKSIPVIVFDPKDFKEELECAVCLSELGEGERARLLPKCNHGFHVDCIDMWFQSHSTCPLCRNPVSPESTSTTTNIHPPPPPSPSPSSSVVVDVNGNGYSTECPNFPTNVLFWGGNNQTQMTTLGSSSIDSSQLNPSCTPSSPSSSSTTTASSSGPQGEMVVIDIPTQTNDQEEEEEEEDVKKLAVAVAVTTRMRSLKRLLSYKDGSF